jgi:DNA-binding PadR family transcriptional regulator
VLEIAVLGLLKEQDMHGYELKKRLADVFGLASAVSFGSLYPALARLEGAGAVSVVTGQDWQVAGDAGSTGPERARRRRKVYSITARGSELFEELLAGSQSGGGDERSFNLRLAFARYLAPDRRLGLLEQRRAVLRQQLAHLAARARARRDDRYMRVLAERQQEALSRDVSWLDDLIREERMGAAGAMGAAAAGPAEPAVSPGVTRGAPTGPVAKLVPLASASQLQRARGPEVPTPAISNSTEPIKDGN